MNKWSGSKWQQQAKTKQVFEASAEAIRQEAIECAKYYKRKIEMLLNRGGNVNVQGAINFNTMTTEEIHAWIVDVTGILKTKQFLFQKYP